MKICIVGAGSIGGFMGVKLHNAGHDVTLIARGPHLEAIKKNGLKLIMHDGTEEVAEGVKATANVGEVSEQEVVVLGVKSHQIEPIIDDVNSLLGDDSVLMTTQNGVPWWYFQKIGNEFENSVVKSVDPNGALINGFDAKHIMGCIAYPAAEISKPGVIKHIEGTRFPVGELDGSVSERATKISEALTEAGMKSPVLEDFRSEMWLKLWGNLSFNPISALTHSTLVDICQYQPSRDLAAAMMTEAMDIAHKLGSSFRVPLEKRIAGAEKVGKHKTSMLQDIEVGKSLEIDAIIGAVSELGRITNIPTPNIDAVLALVQLLNRTVQEEQVFIKAQSWNAK